MKVTITPTLVAAEYLPAEDLQHIDLDGHIIEFNKQVTISDEEYATIVNHTFTPEHGMPCRTFDVLVLCAKSDDELAQEELAKTLTNEVKLFTAAYALFQQQRIVSVSHLAQAATAVYTKMSK